VPAVAVDVAAERRENLSFGPAHHLVDTLQVSRRLRGTKLVWGHSLKAVCERDLGLALDKTEQVSDWSQPPLSDRQQAYAALDAEVLLQLYGHFGRPTNGENLDLWGTRGPL